MREEAASRFVADPTECEFYHSMDLPGLGLQEGDWDLRGRFDDYVAGEKLAGRSVLDVGTASGFLTFEAERRGATVTSFDVASASECFDLPIRRTEFVADYPAWLDKAQAKLERMKNSYWLAHRLLGSSARCVYGDVYELDPTVGMFDVVLTGQILIHLRDGLSALTAAASVCEETLIVVEGSFDVAEPIAALSGRANRPDVGYAWYQYSHGWYREVLTMLGFADVTITTDRFRCNHTAHDVEIELATIVGQR